MLLDTSCCQNGRNSKNGTLTFILHERISCNHGMVSNGITASVLNSVIYKVHIFDQHYKDHHCKMCTLTMLHSEEELNYICFLYHILSLKLYCKRSMF